MLAGYLAAAASLLWNADTGLVVLVAWTASLMVDAVSRGADMRVAPTAARIAGHLALLVLTLVASVASYALFARIRSGRLPDLRVFWQYQDIFYGAGYFMLPMKRCELWQPIIFLYLVVVAGGVRRALQGTANADTRWNLFVALYGLGVFSYYQGRSHVFCLAAVLYPAMILACLLSADLAAAWRAAGYSLKNPEARFCWMKLAGCWLLVGFGLIHFGRGLPTAVAHLARGRPREANVYNEAAIGPLRQRLEGSAAVILSPMSNYLHVQTHSWSALPFSSPQEIVLLAQAREARQALDGRRQVYLVHDSREHGICCNACGRGPPGGAADRRFDALRGRGGGSGTWRMTMAEVRIGNTAVGDGHPCFIVAEIGINHNGDVDLARKLIDVAVGAGCNAVKFQKRTVEVVYTPEELARPRESPFGTTNAE